MKIGIGLPASIPNTPGKLIVDWAKQAERQNFSSLGLVDRIVYPNYEALTTLAVAAGATERIRLITTVLLAPLRNTVIFAKQAATLDALSGGRLTLGLGVGAREDDFKAVGVDIHTRGKLFDEQLALMHKIWSGEPLGDGIGPVGPKPAREGGPEVLIGGYSDKAFERIGRWGNGPIAGGGGPQASRGAFESAKQAWEKGGRTGSPRNVGCAYFGLGENAAARSATYIKDYYSFMGPRADQIAQGVLTTPEAIKNVIQEFAEIGTDEVIFWACIPDLTQVNLLAEVVR
jgi:alkanesulfonate monooxygenase SsuD/methylene tetrahydromethanopterin reductase-like flavin-dependent oxidoreductase (luciferase family)